MTLTVHTDLEQGTDEWLATRCGVLTASVIGKLLTPTLTVANNDTSRGLVATLAAERLTGRSEDVYVNADMQRGNDDEQIARQKYAEHYAPVETVGFMERSFDGFRIGYSPDGLVGDFGLIEIKSRQPKKHIQTILADEVPPENMAQIQCGLLVSGRDWVDYVSFCGGMRLWVKRVEVDQAWQDALIAAARKFQDDCAAMVRAYYDAVIGFPITERTPRAEEIRF